MELCERKRCTGCGACFAVCNKDAIHFECDSLGFRYPVIEKDKCVECGLCRKQCPAINPVHGETNNECIIAWAKDDTIHYNSSSGGVAYLLQQQMLNAGGYVIGCIWDQEFNAVLTVIDNQNDIKKTIGSKYVQSYIGNTVWGDIKRRAKEGQKGLVIGLPCQVAAIKSFTKYDENILYVDLLCRGGCSPGCLKTHLSYLKKKKRLTKITDVRFRGGTNDCYITLWDNDKVVYKGRQYGDAYFYSFMKHGLLRESCYHCKYANSNRVSDLTLADYQGVDPEFIKDKHVMNGTNLVLLHTNKGYDAWDKLKVQLDYYHRPFEEAAEGNSTLREPTPPPSDRDELLTFIEIEGFEKALRHDPVYRRNNNKLRLLKGRVLVMLVMALRQILPSSMYNFIKKTVRRQ